jgi:uncharacterized protein
VIQKFTLVSAAFALLFCSVACKPGESGAPHVISWVEIPARDFERARKFYTALLGAELRVENIQGAQMGFFPNDGTNISGAIAAGPDYEPSASGALVYLNAGPDLAPFLERAAAAGATILVPKTEISPEAGFFALLVDSEGNRIGLQSPQ